MSIQNRYFSEQIVGCLWYIHTSNILLIKQCCFLSNNTLNVYLLLQPPAYSVVNMLMYWAMASSLLLLPPASTITHRPHCQQYTTLLTTAQSLLFLVTLSWCLLYLCSCNVHNSTNIIKTIIKPNNYSGLWHIMVRSPIFVYLWY